MGVLGVGLQDVSTAQLLSTRVSPWSEGHGRALDDLRDIIAAFSVHIGRLTGLAASPQEVVASWPGCPDVVYDVITSNGFAARIFVVYASDTDLAAQEDAQVTLFGLGAIARALPNLKDVLPFHEAAGSLMLDPADTFGAVESLMSAQNPPEKHPATGLASIPRLLNRRSKNNAAGAADDTASQHAPSGLKTLIKRSIGSKRASVETQPPLASPQKHTAPLREIQPLVLADDCFFMATVGEPVPSSPGNLVWFAKLLFDQDKDARPIPQVAERPTRLPENAAAGIPGAPASTVMDVVRAPVADSAGADGSAATQHEAPAVPGAAIPPVAAPEAMAEPVAMAVSQDGSAFNAEAAEGELRERMNGFANTIQQGDFHKALREVVGTLRFLSEMGGPVRTRETHACVAYVLAMQVIIRVKVLESEVEVLRAKGGVGGGGVEAREAEMAILTVFLAELPLVGKHKLVALKMAADKNEPVGNYAVAGRYLQSLVELVGEERKDEFEKRRQVCMGKGSKNAIKPSSMRMCYRTLQLVGSPCLKCNFCAGLYQPGGASGVVVGQLCPLCLRGEVLLVP